MAAISEPLVMKLRVRTWNRGGVLAGLLLNNLSVFRGCEIVFDSADVPEEAILAAGSSVGDVQVSSSPSCPVQGSLLG